MGEVRMAGSPFERWLHACLVAAHHAVQGSVRKSLTFEQLDAEVRHRGGWPDLTEYLRGER